MSTKREAARDLVDFYLSQAFEETATVAWCDEIIEKARRDARGRGYFESAETAGILGTMQLKSVAVSRLVIIEHNIKDLRANFLNAETPQ